MKSEIRSRWPRRALAATTVPIAGLVLASGAWGATFTVNTADDVDDGGCDAAHCSLREAINASNAVPGVDQVAFGIGSGAQTIRPLAALPTVSDPAVIDGTTQPGYAGSPIVELNGDLAGSVHGLRISAGLSAVRGLAINGFDASLLAGIRLELNGGNRIEGNFIGTDLSGTIAVANGSGIDMSSGGNVVGGSTAAARNVISGNLSHGIFIHGSAAEANLIEGNYVGTDVTGTRAVPNNRGILITASRNTVGGTSSGSRNVISGNNEGLRLDRESGAEPGTGNVVHGNYVGTDATGAAAVANDKGILVFGVGNQIGGTDVGAGNVVSGNSLGIWLLGDENVVEGNFVGTDAAGTARLGNGGSGIVIQLSGAGFGGARNRVGGAAPGAGNVISGNGGAGLQLTSAVDNVVQGNLIGTDLTGGQAIPNLRAVLVESASTRNAIGGSGPGEGNVIAFNKSGVAVRSGTANAILGNSLHSSGDHGIDLEAPGDPDAPGITPNDAGDLDTGPNELQNFPVLTSVTDSEVAGTLSSTAGATFRIELFSNTDCDRSGSGEGETFVGATSATTGTAGEASFTVAVASLPSGSFVTATATDAAGNTSEFSACKAAVTDSTPPSVEITDSPAGPTSATSASFSFAANEEASFECLLDAGAFTACSSPQTYSGLGDGSHSFTVRATDGAGNTGTASHTWTVDTVAPTVSIGDRPPALTNATSAELSFSADEPATFTCSSDGSAFTACSSPQAYSGLADGSHSFTVRATDAAGNTGTASAAWTVDATAPTVSAPAFSVNPKSTSETTALSATAADGGSGVTNGEYFIGDDPGAANGTPMSLDGSTLAAVIGTDLTPGLYTVSVRAQDAAGNWSAAAQSILVVYDPTTGYATGGGWMVPGGATSDAGDLLPGLDGTSKANFGFVVKYESGTSTVPAGNLQFHYNAGKFRLKSTGYDWLVVTNENWAKFQGQATIDGASELYPFRVDARDGDSGGGTQTDRFVMRIWAPGADPDTAEPIYKASGDVLGGQVIIHRP